MKHKMPTMAILSMLLLPSWAKACDYVDSGLYWTSQVEDLRDEYYDLADKHNDAVGDQDWSKRCRVLKEIVVLLSEEMDEALEQCARRWNQAINYCSNINRSAAYEASQWCDNVADAVYERLDWAESKYSDDC